MGVPHESARFSELIADSVFIDLPLSGRSFTWCNYQSTPACARLDRVLINDLAFKWCPSWAVRVGKACLSDHAPLILSSPCTTKKKNFHFENCWLLDPSLKSTCEACWSDPTPPNLTGTAIWVVKCRKLRMCLKFWAKNAFNAKREHITRWEDLLEQHLRDNDTASPSAPTDTIGSEAEHRLELDWETIYSPHRIDLNMVAACSLEENLDNIK
ncbi:hypothetical protein Cni_G11349 [Canna indica]|uniref:Endonuclease/exonuclease/phosphatase n=1 Tax=Canna indica TaxID=4628 RepID=A0AAQ3K7X0_9LILI|nr:hypothetical protein Cni_G11349 [Canna indica]